jgi:hypothetical protein
MISMNNVPEGFPIPAQPDLFATKHGFFARHLPHATRHFLRQGWPNMNASSMSARAFWSDTIAASKSLTESIPR